MRKILFRGKSIDNGEWVEGTVEFHLIDGDLSRKDKKAFITYDEMDSIGKVYRFTFEVDPETVVQYTGLKDKNGKRIFEGDILKHFTNNPNPDSYFLAIVGHEAGAFCLLHIKGRYRIRNILWDCPSDSYEVAGSIHDKPELLEVQK